MFLSFKLKSIKQWALGVFLFFDYQKVTLEMSKILDLLRAVGKEKKVVK